MINSKILNILTELTDVKLESLKKINLIESGILDSYSILILITELENKFKISTNPEKLDIKNIETYKKIIQLVKKKQKI